MEADEQPSRGKQAGPTVPVHARRLPGLRLRSGLAYKSYFGANALVTIIVLLLIVAFLFREGAGFFGQNAESLRLYRQSGLEMADQVRQQADDFGKLLRYFDESILAVEVGEAEARADAAGLDPDAAWEQVTAETDDLYLFRDRLEAAGRPLRELSNELVETAREARNDYKVQQERAGHSARLRNEGREGEASAIRLEEVNLLATGRKIAAQQEAYQTAEKTLEEHLAGALQEPPKVRSAKAKAAWERFRDLAQRYLAELPAYAAQVEQFDPAEPVPFSARATNFFFGTRWISNSFIKDWYGILPLLSGSVLVSLIALCLAVPFGIAAAIYVSQLAGPRERSAIKPCVEFITAIPSVVIGFFGIAVWGDFVQTVSHWEVFNWLPFFPVAERLNVFTAGCLLALMAVPTIFTLAEDALTSVPRSYAEGSNALGATRLQTSFRVIVPTALPGMVSAVLLGFGRVVGETMVVLLCAGNRLAIPDFTHGLGVFFEPVHTMTGIIAQEMSETAPGSIHYRALFLVGVLLFMISLAITATATRVIRRYNLVH